MAEEEEKPQKIPSWVDPTPPRRRPTRPTAPTPTHGRTLNVNLQTPPGAPQEPRQMRESAQQAHQQQHAQPCQSMGMVPVVNSFDLMNLQMSAIMAAQHMAPVIAPMNQWGHLNPNFVFPDRQMGMGYGSQSPDLQVAMENAGPDPDVHAFTSYPEHPQPARVPDMSPDGQQTQPSVVGGNRHSGPNVDVDDPFASKSPQHALSINTRGPGASLPMLEPNTPTDDIYAIANKILDDLSDEKKRRSYLPAPAATAPSATPQQSLPTLPTLPALPTSNQVGSALSTSSIPLGPPPHLNPPSAPKLMILRNGRDISKAGSAYLRQNSNSPQSAKKGIRQERYQLREELPVTPSKNTREKKRAEEGTRNDEDLLKKLPIRPVSAEESGNGPRETPRDIPRGRPNTTNEDGRLQSLVASTIAQDPSSRSHIPNPRVHPPGTISTPSYNPFLEFDPHRPDPFISELRRNEETVIQHRYKRKFKRLTESEVDKSRFLRRGGSARDWPQEKSRLLEKLAKEHYKSRVGLERKHRRRDEEIAKANDDHFVKVLADSGINIMDLRTTPHNRNLDVGITSIPALRAAGDATGKPKTGAANKQSEGQKISSGIGGTRVASTTRPLDAGSAAVHEHPQGLPRDVVHHTMLLSSALRNRHERELRWFDEDTTAQERAEVVRRQQDEWEEWHAALLLRHAASRKERQGQGRDTQRHETGRRTVGDIGAQTSGGAEESFARKKRKRVRPRRGSKSLADPSHHRQAVGTSVDPKHVAAGPIQTPPTAELALDNLGSASQSRRTHAAHLTMLTSGELTALHSHQMTSLHPGTTEQEKREMLRRQEDELVEWHAAQRPQRQQAVDKPDLLILKYVPAKRKAIEGTEDGGRRKLVRANDSAAVEPRVHAASTEAAMISPTTVDMSDVVVPSHGQPASRATGVGKSDNLPAEDTDMTEPSAEEVEKSSVEEFDRVFNSVGDSAAFSQFGAGEADIETEETGVETQVTPPAVVIQVVQAPRVADSARTHPVVQALAQSLEPVQISHPSQVLQAPQPPVVTNAAQVAQVARTSHQNLTGPPIPAGEWILDKFLQSLPDPSLPLPRPPPPPSSPAPASRFKGLSCVIS